ncbi:MAG: ATP-binding protein [Coriobacteriaceae bacterium]|nr:ATP-binding protein [Coriobacteriaceae bacterium]
MQENANRENDNIEYKSSWRDEWLKWVCGFANARGGAIYIGVDDGGCIVGVKDAHRLLEDIPNKIVSGLGIAPAVRKVDDPRGSFIEIEIEPQAFPVSYKGQYYMRVGATNQLLKGTALDTFLLRKQGQSWDNAPVPGLSADDLDRGAMDRFVARAGELGRVPDGAPLERPEAFLSHLHLLRDGYLTNAAALLFSADPEARVPGSTVKVGFFDGPEILYQDVVGGPVIDQAEKVIDLIYSKYLKAKIGYEGIRRTERFPFPRAAVREAVVNAIAHKDYASGAPVQIRVYADALQVGNPCVLPEGWTLDSLLGWHESDPHNPKMANVFFLAGYVESWGRGVQKIFTSCKLDGLEPPEYRMAGNALQVVFRAPEDRVVRVAGVEAGKAVAEDTGFGAVWRDLARFGGNWRDLAEVGRKWPEFARCLGSQLDSLDEHDLRVLERLAVMESEGSSAMATALGIPTRSLQRRLSNLVDQGLVSAKGNARARTYSLNLNDEGGR